MENVDNQENKSSKKLKKVAGDVKNVTENAKKISGNVKTIIVCVTILVAIVLGVFVVNKYLPLIKGFIGNVGGFFSGIFKTELSIKDTPTVVSEIRKINELSTYCFYSEMVLKDSKNIEVVNKSYSLTDRMAFGSGWHYDTIAKQNYLVILAKGKVKAGFDLSKMTDNDVKISRDTLFIRLPKAEILDVLMNPSDVEVFAEEGSWSHQEMVCLENQGIERLRNDALSFGIIEKSERIGIKKIENLLKTFGFKSVVVSIPR